MEEVINQAEQPANPPMLVHAPPRFDGLLNVEKSHGQNHPMRKFKTNIRLQAKKLFAIVDGSYSKKDSDDEEEWTDRDYLYQSLICAAIEPKYMRQLMTCTACAQIWRCGTIHEHNASENLQLLQQKFYEFRMRHEEDVANHVSNIEVLANLLTDLGELISTQAPVTKIVSTLTPVF